MKEEGIGVWVSDTQKDCAWFKDLKMNKSCSIKSLGQALSLFSRQGKEMAPM